MSKERARAREARVAARQAEVAAAAKARAKKAKRADLKARVTPTLPKKKHRGLRQAAEVLAITAAVQVVSIAFIHGLRAHAGLAVLTLAALFVYVVSARRSPTR